MSNSAVVRSFRHHYNFYFNTPIFNKYGKSLRDFLGVTSMVLGALLLMLFFFVLFIDHVPYDYRSSCGTPECIDQ